MQNSQINSASVFESPENEPRQLAPANDGEGEQNRAFLATGSTHAFYLPSLDGARGIAILLVLLDHLSSAKIIPYVWLRGLGHIGVYLFFSLSAFLLTAPFWLRNDGCLMRAGTWSTYFRRRFLRIYPLYILALGVTHFTNPDFSWQAVRDHLLLRRGD